LSQQVDKLRQIVAPPTEAAGYELVDVEWKHEQGGWICRVFIDKPDDQKIGHEDCERVSRELSAILDVADAIPQAYSLEVSSPGLNRPLRTLAHFKKFIGQTARVKLVLGVNGRRNYRGTILSVDADTNTIKLEVDGQEHVLPLSDLDKANLEYDFTKGQGT
jgi:ribosome maturation factor RimP